MDESHKLDHMKDGFKMMLSMKPLRGLIRGRGINEAVKICGVKTLHSCNEVGQAMQNVKHTKKAD